MLCPWRGTDCVPHPCAGGRVARSFKRDPLGGWQQRSCGARLCNMDARQQAQHWVRYYSNCDPQFAKDWWLAGLQAAHKWLQLVESPSVSQDEVASLLATAKANQRNGSGWSIMALLIYSWAKETGHSVPSHEEFFEHSRRTAD